jgi:hypothetical protein
MDISNDELRAMGFKRGGTVRPDPAPLRCVNPGSRRQLWKGLYRVENTWDVEGYVVFIMVVDQEFKKAGYSGTGASGFKIRMESCFNCLRPVIAGGPPYRGDPFTQYAPAALLAHREVELWAKPHETEQSMLEEVRQLNRRYRGEWTREGWARDGRGRLPGSA